MKPWNNFGAFIFKQKLMGAVWSFGKKVWKYNTFWKKCMTWLTGIIKVIFGCKKILVPAIFWSFFTYYGSKKWPEPKKLLTWKITFSMPMKEYLMFVHPSAVYSHFLSELQTAPISFCIEINAPKLFQGFLITYYLVISGLLVDSPKVGMI